MRLPPRQHRARSRDAIAVGTGISLFRAVSSPFRAFYALIFFFLPSTPPIYICGHEARAIAIAFKDVVTFVTTTFALFTDLRVVNF